MLLRLLFAGEVSRVLDLRVVLTLYFPYLALCEPLIVISRQLPGISGLQIDNFNLKRHKHNATETETE